MWRLYGCLSVVVPLGLALGQPPAERLLTPPAERLLTPADAVLQAWADVQTLPPEVQEYTRYLTCFNEPEKDRPVTARVLNGHVNGLSRASDLPQALVVPDTCGSLLRVNLLDYEIDVKVWEQLADADPYFHVRVIKEVVEKTYTPRRTWQVNGQWYTTHQGYQVPRYRWDSRNGQWLDQYGDYEETTKKARKKVGALAPDLSDTPATKAALAGLVAATQSKTPLLRADWFFNQTAAQVDRKPGYYDFLGIKDRETFQALGGFDAKRKRRKVELREAVADSSVTLQPRAISRWDADEGGAYWFTDDFRKAVDKKNPLRVLGREIDDQADAHEEYISLPNFLWATGLFSGKGERQDSAPDFIASDGRSGSNDRRVHVNVGCLRCHQNGGLQDIDGWVRNLFQPPLAVQSPDYKALRVLQQQYLRRLEPYLERDRARYAEAVLECTGWTAKEYAAKYASYWERYEDAKVDAAWVARDLGVTEDCFLRALDAAVKANQADPVLSVFLLRGPRRRTLLVRQYEEVYPFAQAVLKGFRHD